MSGAPPFIPLIILAYAHERNESKPPLRNLLKEQLKVSAMLAPMVQQNLCETRAIVNASVERLSELIEREGERIVGLHYGSDVATLIRVREGKRKSMERALKGKLGRQLGALPNLKWVFLSGDGNQEQAEALLKVGVPLVMRSHNLISDDAAYRLAYFFYQELGQGQTLGRACELATFEVRRDYMNKAKLTYGHELPSGYGSDWPFEYHLAPHLPSVERWSLYSQAQRLDGLPKVDERLLPELPFCDFAPISASESGLFGGRPALSRALFELLNAPQRPPVVVLYGPQGSGKSSLIQAAAPSLLGRLFQLKRALFSPDGLSGLGEALHVDEHAPLLKEWLSQEGNDEQAQLSQQAINDLINEAQALFKSHYRVNEAHFSSFLQTIRAMSTKAGESSSDNVLKRLGELFQQQEQGGPALNLNTPPLLVCLDQVERAFGELDPSTARRQERFWTLVRALAVDPERAVRGALLLVVDERAYPQLKRRLEERMIRHADLYVPMMSEAELEGYLKRFVHERALQERYPLITDERFARRAAHALSANPTLVGTRLQALLRSLWRRSPRRPVLWTEEALISLQDELGELSLNALLQERVSAFETLMRAQGDEEFHERLALDLLYHLALCAYQPERFAAWLAEARPEQRAEAIDQASDLELEERAQLRYAESLIPQQLSAQSGSPHTLTGQGPSAFTRPSSQHDQESDRAQLATLGAHLGEGRVAVGAFLSLYLNWGVELPSPWAERQRALADQALWALMQAIDLGLLRGRVGAGEALPVGVLSLPHPELFKVIEARWSELNALSMRQVQRFCDVLTRGAAPSLEECELAREGFAHTRLPNVREAEALARGSREAEVERGRAEAQTRQGQLTRWLLAGLILVSAGRCTQLSIEREDLDGAHQQLKDQVRLYVAERLSDRGELDLSAALLSEVESVGLEGWSKGALKVLSHPISAAQLSDRAEWERVEFTPQAMWIKLKGGGQRLQPLNLTSQEPTPPARSLGAPLLVAHSPSGARWCSLEGDQLRFSEPLNASREGLGSHQLSGAQLKPKQLLLTSEGPALLLDARGELWLTSPSAHVPLKSPTPLVSVAQSPRGALIVAQDERGGLHRVDVRAQALRELTAPTSEVSLKRLEWGARAEALVAYYELRETTQPREERRGGRAERREGERLVRLYRASGAHVDLYQGRAELSLVEPSESGLSLLAYKSGALELTDLQGARRTLPLKLKLREALLDPQGRRAALLNKAGDEVTWLDLERPQGLRRLGLPSTGASLSLSDDGAHLLMQSANVARVWQMSDGALIEDFEHPRGALLGASLQGQHLFAAFSAPQDEQSAHLKVWPLSAAPLMRRLYWPGDEVSDARFGVADELWVGTGRGEVYGWSVSASGLKRQSALHQGELSALAPLSSGALISASSDGSLAFLSNGRDVARQLIAHEQPVTLLEVNPRGDLVLSADRRGQSALWSEEGELKSGGLWAAHDAPLRFARFSPDGATLLTSSVKGETKLWRLTAQGAPTLVQRVEQPLYDARWLSEAGADELIALTTSGAVERWSLASGGRATLIAALKGFERGALSQDGARLVRVSGAGQATLYDLTDPRSLRAPRELTHKAGPLSAVELSGELVALGAENGEVWLWSASEGARRLGRHEGAVRRLSFNPSQRDLLSTSPTQALLWRGPFHHSALAAKLNERAPLCLSLEERLRLLGESPKEAEAQRARCLARQRP